jgi:hypothetical protein
MTSRLVVLAVVSAFVAVFVAASPTRLHGQQPSQIQQQYDEHHQTAPEQAAPAAGNQQARMMMGAMHANDQKVDELVKKMNAAKGNDKVDAMAELLTTLVQDRRTMQQSMSNMSMMMNMMRSNDMGGMHGRGNTSPTQKQ